MRGWVVFPLVLVSICASANHGKRALVIGVDHLPALDERYMDQQVLGAQADADNMAFLLQCCGYTDVKVLKGRDATLHSVRSAMNQLLTQAGDKDETVLYFSGKGSVDTSNPTLYEPTLTLYDCELGSASHDLQIKEVEKWAARIAKPGRRTVDIVLDASFSSGHTRGLARHFRNVPKSLPLFNRERGYSQTRRIRSGLFDIPGVAFISAATVMGRAYEWRDSFVENGWCGAFTDYFVGSALERQYSGHPETLSWLVNSCRSYFKPLSATGYMSGIGPSIAGSSGIAGQIPAFCCFDPPRPVASVGTKFEARAKFFVEAQSSIGVAIQPVPEELERSRDELTAQVKKYLADNGIGGVTVLPPGGAHPSRVLAIDRDSSGNYEVRVIGNDYDTFAHVDVLGPTLDDALNSDVGNYLEVLSLAQRIWNELEVRQPTMPGLTCTIGSHYPPGADVAITYTTPEAGRIYLFDRDDSDPAAQMAFPNFTSSDGKVANGPIMANSASAGESQLPYNLNTGNGQFVPRQSTVRFLFLPDSVAKSLPPIGASKDVLPYAAMDRHLRALLEKLTDGKSPWSSAFATYEVVQR